MKKQPRKFLTDDARAKEANRRQSIMQTVEKLKSEKQWSEKKACKKAGVDLATYGRWRHRYEAEGFIGLLPNQINSGRESAAKKFGVTSEIVEQVKGIQLDTESNTASWRIFARSGACPEALSEAILDPCKCSKHAIAPSLLAATRISEPVKNAHRGGRRLALKGISTPRALDIIPGDVFTSDDTTPIWAWWVPWETTKDTPYGVKVLQGQFLPVMDVASQCAIAYALICRDTASYKACDIWALFGHVFDNIGLPRLGWQLERGSWEGNLIEGQEIEYMDGEVSLARRVGGLRQLPTNITDWHREKLGPDLANCFPKTLQTWKSFLPKSKSIEAWFDRSQTFEGMLWGSLGRDQMRKPMEKTKKIYGACKRGAADPRLHFLSQQEMSMRLTQLTDYLNRETMEGTVFRGIPKLLWDETINQHPLLLMPEDSRWLYKRNWKRTKMDGYIRITIKDEATGQSSHVLYCNARLAADYHGQEIFVYYDRENPRESAEIVLASSGKYIGHANYEAAAGMFFASQGNGHQIRKDWANAVKTEYAVLVKHAPSRQLPPEIAQRRAEAQVLQATQTSEISRNGAEAKTDECPQAHKPRGSVRFQIMEETI